MSGVEKRAFTKYLDSEYHNPRIELTTFWRLILDKHLSKGQKFDPPDLFLKVYPKQVFNDRQFRHLCSWLLKKIESFFIMRKMEEQPIERKIALATVYREKRIHTEFAKHLKDAKELMLKKKMDPSRFLTAYKINFEQYSFIESTNRTDSTNLQVLSDSLDEYLIVSKLKQSCLMLAHQAVYKVQYDFSFLNQLLEFLKDHPMLEKPITGLYYHCYRAISENDSTHFYKFKHLISKHQKEFSSKETSNLLLFALNFCIRQINQGKHHYEKEAWDLYQLGIGEKSFHDNQYLGRFTFKNIVALGIKLKEFNWTNDFIVKYTEELNPKYQKNYHNYNLAQLKFAQKDYQRAMPLLSKVDDTDLLLNFDAKIILIKMYYELQEFDALDSLLGSFSVSLQRKKVVGYHKSYYKEFIRQTKKLLDLPISSSSKRDQQIKEVNSIDKFPEKDWFIRMLHQKNS